MTTQDLFNEAPEQPQKPSIPGTCLGMTFETDEARRAHFTEELRKKLQDPQFRKIEGFPIGSDEDILNLSDPPYYTACNDRRLCIPTQRPDRRGSLWAGRRAVEVKGQLNQGWDVNALDIGTH